MNSKGNDGKGNIIERDEWETNQDLWNKLNDQYNFGFDCCANKLNSKCSHYSFDFEKIKPYLLTTAWMNPPFSKARKMFEHFFKVIKKGVAIYRFDNAETKIWQELIFPKATWIFIPKGRIRYTPFNIDMQKGLGTRFPSALIGYNVPLPKGIKGICLKKVENK